MGQIPPKWLRLAAKARDVLAVASRLEQPSVVGFPWLITGCVCEIVGLSVCPGATHLTLLGSCQIGAS
jgi:hypothetical protein